MRELTVGKTRGLQQISNPQGIFTMLAVDQRGSLQKQLGTGDVAASFDEMVTFKRQVTAALAPYASAVLLDPIFAAAQTIVGSDLPGRAGLLVSIEATGYEGDAKARRTGLVPGWSVEKIRRMGAQAVKLLLYYNPDAPTAAEQERLCRQVAAECQKHDILFLMECVTYPVRDGEDKGDLVIESAKRLAPLGVDVYKAEFPGEGAGSPDRLLDNCNRLTNAVNGPWVLLSAGVDWELFRAQADIAMRGGACGFLAGRAMWKEAIKLKGAARETFLRTTSAARFQELVTIAEQAMPWTKRLQADLARVKVTEGWHERY
ncbi:MAG: tagatose 1,6-diphosphate aldolase [Anaerolineae bacterium]|nr:tagatose 1,6-diphosphate aldolase [Anaerolineae bacterium]